MSILRNVTNFHHSNGLGSGLSGETRAGGVLVAVKTNSFSSCREVTDLQAELKVVALEIITKAKLKFLICCCYRTPEPEKN